MLSNNISETHIRVDQQEGSALYRKIPAKRPANEFDITKMSVATKDAFKRVCVTGDATPEDYRHVFSAILRTRVLDSILGVS